MYVFLILHSFYYYEKKNTISQTYDSSNISKTTANYPNGSARFLKLQRVKGLVSKQTVMLRRWGGETPKVWIYQLSCEGNLATVKNLKADVSSVSPLSERT